MFIGTWEIELHIQPSAYLVRNYSDLVTALSPRCNLALLAWCGLQKRAAQSIRCKWDQGDIWEWWPSGSKKVRPGIGLREVDWFQAFCSYCASPGCWSPTATSTQPARTQLPESWNELDSYGPFSRKSSVLNAVSQVSYGPFAIGFQNSDSVME